MPRVTWVTSSPSLPAAIEPKSPPDRHPSTRRRMTMLAMDRPAAAVSTAARSQRRTLARSALITGVFIIPAVVTRITGLHTSAIAALLIFGAAVVAASFLLAWAAEAAQIDVSGGMATALLALIAVLPEYAVDLYYAYVS